MTLPLLSEISASLGMQSRQDADRIFPTRGAILALTALTARGCVWRNHYQEFQEGRMQSLSSNSLEDIK